MTNPKISVIIPVYNAEKYLKQCLDSLLCQTLDSIEIICINDGSSDNSINILKQYKEQYDNITVLDQKHSNAGVARNKGIAAAKGEYLAFLDADDYYPNHNSLKTLYYNAIYSNSNICGGNIVYCYNRLNNEEISCLHKFETNEELLFSNFQWDYEFYRYIFKRSFIVDNELFFPNYLFFEDPPFLLNAMVLSISFFSVKDVVYCYRIKRNHFDFWKTNKITDLTRGLLYCLKISIENDLKELQQLYFNRINGEYRYAFISGLRRDDKEIIPHLIEIDSIFYSKFNYKGFYEKIQLDIKCKKHERNKINNVFGHCRINKIKNSIKHNGLFYTFNRILFHLNIYKDNDPERTYSVNHD